MMSHEQQDSTALRAALDALAASESSTAGGRLGLDEIHAYARDLLPAEEADTVREWLALDPEAARLAAAMARFEAGRARAEKASTEMVTPEAEESLSARELDEDWRRLSARVGIASDPPQDHPVVRAQPDSVPHRIRPVWRFPNQWRVPALTAAAGVVLALGLWRVGEQRVASARHEPRVNVVTTQLREDASRRSDAQPNQIAADAPFQLLVLNLAQGAEVSDPRRFDRYALEIWPHGTVEAQEPVWRGDGVELAPDLSATVELGQGFLAPGAYELRLLGLAGETEQMVASFSVEVR